MTTGAQPLADHAELRSVHTATGVAVETMTTAYRTQAFPRHSHETYTIGIVLGGTGTLWLSGRNHVAGEGDIVVIPPGAVHTGSVGAGSSVLSYVAVYPPAALLAAVASASGRDDGALPEFSAAVIHDSAAAAPMRSLFRAISSAPIDDAAAEDALNTALTALIRDHAAPRRSTVNAVSPFDVPRAVHIARQLLDDCYADGARTSLRALAESAGVTPFHLVRVFSRSIGLSPHQYLVQVRIGRARDLLTSGVTPSIVAAMTGFVDQSHMTTQFKRYVGTTPGQYQKGVRAR